MGETGLIKNGVKDYTQLDLLKIVLACIVILRHCGQTFFEVNSLFYVIVTNIISPIAVPAFFTISGFLFFNKKRDTCEIKKYVCRILRLYIIWTLIYMPIIVLSYFKHNLLNFGGLLDFIRHFFFDGSFYHLWYLPSMIVAITIVCFLYNVLSKCRLAKRTCDFFLLISSLVLYTLGVLVDTYLIFGWGGYKEIFLTTRNGLFFGMIFVVIGKLIADYKPQYRSRLMILGNLIYMVEAYYVNVVSGIASIVNMYLTTIVVVPQIVICVINMPKLDIDGKFIRNVGTVMFCCHPFVIIACETLVLDPIIQTMITLLLTLIVSLIAVKLSSKIKLMKMLY